VREEGQGEGRGREMREGGERRGDEGEGREGRRERRDRRERKETGGEGGNEFLPLHGSSKYHPNFCDR
jgi:hypothetical protein